MLDILAQTTAPGAHPWCAELLTMTIPMALGVFLGGWVGYYFGFKREWKLRIRIRKEELPARVLGRLEECAMLTKEDLKLGFMARYWERVPDVLERQRPEQDRERSRGFEERKMALVEPHARSYRELLTSIGELKALHRDDSVTTSNLDAGLWAAADFDPAEFDFQLAQMSGKTPDELDEWCQSKQREIADFVNNRLWGPVLTAIEATDENTSRAH